MRSPGPPRRAATAGGVTVGPAEVDDADAAAMAAMFEAVLPGLPAGEARRRLAAHGWDLQAALAGAAREDPARPLFDGAPLGRGTGAPAAQQGRMGRESENESEDASEDGTEQVELRVRMADDEAEETEEIVRVRPDVVDLTAYTGLVALPEELRAFAWRVRTLKVSSDQLEALPAWLGELTGLTELRVGGWFDRDKTKMRWCPLRELPAEVERLSGLLGLILHNCRGLSALPVELGALTRLEKLDVGGCSGLTALPAGLGAGLWEINLSSCSGLTALPAGLGALTRLWSLALGVSRRLQPGVSRTHRTAAVAAATAGSAKRS